jgi:hypothetical protein
VSWVQAGNFDAGTAYAAFDRHTFGDMSPYLYKTTDYGAHWTALLSPADTHGVRGYAHVIREDLRKPDLLFLGTEFGLWISVDGGSAWAQFKGSHLPNVAVRDLAIQPRDNDLVIATHGRGIWIVDDITPLRTLSTEVLQKEASFAGSRPVQQRIEAQGGWANGAAAFVGDDVTDGAVITYYQRERHLYGKLKIEVLDAAGKVVDELPASTRRGLNRVVWNMHVKPPRVPPAAQLAFNGTQGPRVVPGLYTVRMTKNGQIYDLPLDVAVDRRSKHSLADRRQQFEAAQKVSELFGDESDLFAKVTDLRQNIAKRIKVSAEAKQDDLVTQLHGFDDKVDAVRKQIVATKEGGAITGEERLREHTDQLYGAVTSWDGRPAGYQLAYIASLRHELDDIEKQFSTLTTIDLPAVNDALKAKQQDPLTVLQEVPVADDDAYGSGQMAGRDRDADAQSEQMVPRDLRLSY